MQNLFIALILFAGVHQVSAQGTAFTYQGRLNDNGNPASGTYDLQFTLRDALTAGNVIGSSLTNSTVAVSNGLFTVTVDFGGGVFSGAARWLEIGVRTNGSVSAYTTLSPRQPITSTPYAIQAASATTATAASTASSLSGTLPATSLIGTISDARLSANVAMLNANNTFSGTVTAAGFSGNGAMPWQAVAGTAQTAAPNTAYLLNNAAQTTVTLPAAPNVGDVVRVSGAGARGWKVAQNPGQTIYSGNLPATIGLTWAARESSRLVLLC